MTKRAHAFVILAIVIQCCGLHCGIAEAYTPKIYTRLVADVDNRNPSSPGRIPLILIHGLNGTGSDAFYGINGRSEKEKQYFYNFLNYFYDSDLKYKYCIYRFHYLSNKMTAKEIAQDLALWLDDLLKTGGITDRQFVIAAHSMGGLVARSYMQEQQHSFGKYANQAAGNRVLKLVTLATPHHGSPSANEDARITPAGLWSATLDFLDEIIWGSSGPSVTEPNRSDLRWDNYNYMVGYDLPDELNAWLFALNENSEFFDKVVAYYGNISGDNYRLVDLYRYLGELTPAELAAWYSYCWVLGTIPPEYGPYSYPIPFDAHVRNVASSVIMSKFYAIASDGIVPIDSGRLSGNPLLKIEELNGYDHDDMRMADGNDSSVTLFNKIRTDLDAAYAQSQIVNVAAAEYFIDKDPGEGNGTAIPPKDGSFDRTMEELDLSVDTSGLTTGIHSLSVRMRGSNWFWGTPRKIVFEVTGERRVAAAEYFLDTDPGEGKGISLSAEDGMWDQPLENLAANIDTSTVSPGNHNLFIRAMDAEGRWGAARLHAFEVQPLPTLASAEFFVDADPGVGNGTAMDAEDGSFNSTVESLRKTFNTGSLDLGTHTVYVRVKDSCQRWSTAKSVSLLNGTLLSVVRSGNGAGSVSGDEARISCGADCTEIYSGQTVTLTAIPDPGSTFMNWTGCTSSSGDTCTVLMTADRSVTAVFADVTPPDTAFGLKPDSLTNSPSATFTFTSTEGNSTFECRFDTASFVVCTSPQSWAVPFGLHTFEVRAIDAAANPDPTPAGYTWERKALLALGFGGSGKGAVTSSPSGIAANNSTAFLLAGNSAIRLSAKEDGFSLFGGWSGDCSGVADCLLTMDKDKAVTASFQRDSAHNVLMEVPGPTYYPSIGEALLHASGPTVVKVWGTDYTENVLFNCAADVTFRGGYDAGYATNTGTTILHGAITIRQGRVTLDKFFLR